MPDVETPADPWVPFRCWRCCRPASEVALIRVSPLGQPAPVWECGDDYSGLLGSTVRAWTDAAIDG